MSSGSDAACAGAVVRAMIAETEEAGTSTVVGEYT
jgi:hypothetical protein